MKNEFKILGHYIEEHSDEEIDLVLECTINNENVIIVADMLNDFSISITESLSGIYTDEFVFDNIDNDILNKYIKNIDLF